MRRITIIDVIIYIFSVASMSIFADTIGRFFNVGQLGVIPRIVRTLSLFFICICLDPDGRLWIKDRLSEAYKHVSEFGKWLKESLVAFFNRVCDYIKRNLKYISSISITLNLFLIGIIVILIMRGSTIVAPSLPQEPEQHKLRVYGGMDAIHGRDIPFYWTINDSGPVSTLIGMISSPVFFAEFSEFNYLWCGVTYTITIYSNDTNSGDVSVTLTVGNPHANVEIDGVIATIDIATFGNSSPCSYGTVFATFHRGYRGRVGLYIPIYFVAGFFDLNVSESDGVLIITS